MKVPKTENVSTNDISISIIVPVYNVEKYLQKCLTSLVKQTLKNIEIILVNDGSTDSSVSIIEEYQKQYPTVKVIHQKNSGGGAGGPRNSGIEAARGEYIGFVDSDDWTSPSMFEELYLKVKETDSDIVICDYKMYWQNEGRFTSSWEDRDRYIWKKYLNKWTEPFKANEMKYALLLTVYPWRKMYKKKLLQSHGIRFPVGMIFDDIPFHWQTLVCASKISTIDRPLYFYRRERPEQDVAAKDERLFSVLTHHEIVRQFLVDHSLFETYVHYLIRSEFITFKWILGKLDEGLKRQFFKGICKSFQLVSEKDVEGYFEEFRLKGKDIKEIELMRTNSYDEYIAMVKVQSSLIHRACQKIKAGF